MKKTWIFFVINLGLWLYTASTVIQTFLDSDVALDTKYHSSLLEFRNWLGFSVGGKFSFNWRSLIFALILLALAVLMVKFWTKAFWVLFVVTVLIVILYLFAIFKNTNFVKDYFTLIVMIVSLGNVWFSAKHSGI